MKRKIHNSTKKLSVLWTVYHTILVVELFVLIIIETIELLQ